ncbi:hypothetical protein J3458_016160 [Metarhizium acridum]|uniref:uncharacterized protein n=1 Tax=Metarhizium acridum TaxID=92637 RepID=UPI001C6C0457|nr:hypothetical protein J3458_016160 [Metarhizium acridum]
MTKPTVNLLDNGNESECEVCNNNLPSRTTRMANSRSMPSDPFTWILSSPKYSVDSGANTLFATTRGVIHFSTGTLVRASQSTAVRAVGSPSPRWPSFLPSIANPSHSPRTERSSGP